ncbi:unnamed protein product [Rotaria socialis]|uniref:Anti-proliferative protein domain-containing protein n=1 Tax=Rotaria socialis TaxID=392032 RepID=A0A817U3X7_9BILA|nr:unnamed protein product [Rotaria socialis]CAF3321596.1 unnamed protein product [Rotaria socialis]CAF3342954.1 unnamed protein product [Rotaria socialis]CAF3376463.1 unnamed protein product [Rotaria socialis]CAF3616773.1 unnamed protein product [Rotaria socialis]
MTNPKKELNVACSYLLRLMKAHVALSTEQINVFKRTFYDILSKRFVGHWFPATPHRGSAYRCLQTKHWKDPVLKSIAERARLPLHQYLPVIFTMWIDPGEVAVCFGDDGTWCPLYKHDADGKIQQTYSDGEETMSSSVSDDDLSSVTQNVKSLNINNKQVPSNTSTTQTIDNRSSDSFLNTISTDTNTQIQSFNDYNCSTSNTLSSQTPLNDWNVQQNNFWSQHQLSMLEGLYQGGNF